MKKTLFLYSEVSGYLLACIQQLINDYKIEVHIVHFPVNKEAPFEFSEQKGIKFYERNKYNNKQLLYLVKSISPDLIFCSGWIDKYYLFICRKYFKKVPTVMGIDTPWEGTLRQYIASLISPFFLLKCFSYIWVAGEPQYPYALKLGFKNSKILTGYYSADFDLFYKHYKNVKILKSKIFPKRFLYVGRYNKIKGIHLLWQAFIELQNEYPNEWELWCIGTGEYKKIFPNHPKIKNLGFVQQKNLGEFIKDTGVFVFPCNLYEHWGVALHEFAAAGFPLICSDIAGAATVFLQNNINGYLHKAGSVDAIKNALKKMIAHSDKELIKMGERSVELAKQITPETWAKTLMLLLEKK